jgi:hypothetical protein
MNKKYFNLTVFGVSALVLFAASVAVEAAENPFALPQNGAIETLAFSPPPAMSENKADAIAVDNGDAIPQNEDLPVDDAAFEGVDNDGYIDESQPNVDQNQSQD